ncbi:hypothetical protein AB0L63_20260 [Nocardia sp. NPDC051990]
MDQLFLVAHGKVEKIYTGESIEQQVVSTISSGDYLGGEVLTKQQPV